MSADHLVKILADRGIASRRGSERLIRDGAVTVDGAEVREPGALIDPDAQEVKVQGRRLPPPPKRVHLVLHKPRGVVTTADDPEGRRTVFDLIPRAVPGLAAVGRLDYGSEGVLLLTNDGELAYRLTHPAYGVSKSYLAKVSGTPDGKKLARLARGVTLDDGPTGPAGVELVSTSGPSAWVLVTVHQGRNRVVRRMLEHVGHPVLKLKRVGFAGITLRGLEPGQSRELTAGELEYLRRKVRSPGKGDLDVSRPVREAVAEALRLPPPPPDERSGPRHLDEEGRPYRKKGWARPRPKGRRAIRKRGKE